MPHETNTTLAAIAERLLAAESLLITAHAKPDGDALGSTAALAETLRALGKRVQLRLMGPMPINLHHIADRVEHVIHEDAGPIADEPDLVVVLDTDSWSQIEPLRDWIEPRAAKTIVIDHHLAGDGVGDMRYIDSDAAAAAEIVADLLDHFADQNAADLTAARANLIAEALFLGIASDTGWFRFSNTRPQTHELAARLQAAGVDHAALYLATEQGERTAKVRLLARALGGMELLADDHVALLTLREADFEASGATLSETERFVDFPQMAEAVRVVVLVVEQEGRTRLSFRSKPGPGAVDVSELAARFGGGGHARAAGAKVEQPIDLVLPTVRQAIDQLAF
jgi:phosphoesterase RecJ-like protein